MNKPIHPAVAQHVIEENEKLRELLVEVAHCLRTTDEQPLYWEENFASRIYRALSQQAEPIEPAPAQDEREAFEREDRYLVIKYSDLNKVDPKYRLPFMEYLDDVSAAIPHREYVVVESDWPEYEQVWKMIEDRVAGSTRPAQTEQQPVAVPEGWRLVPVEPTREMWEASGNAVAKLTGVYVHHDIVSRVVFDAMLSAAPIAQTAPQPAEQQPALTKYQSCGCVICTCEHETQCQGCGAKHCGTHPVGQIPGPIYQQPAPDVSALVEAAEAALGEIEGIMQEAYNSAYPVCCGRPGSECCGSPDPEWEEADQRMMDRLAPHQKALRDALAAHRKQGGEV